MSVARAIAGLLLGICSMAAAVLPLPRLFRTGLEYGTRPARSRSISTDQGRLFVPGTEPSAARSDL